jgi:hypothetical protein
MDRRRRGGGDGERSRGTGVMDLLGQRGRYHSTGGTYRFLLEGPSGLELLDAARRGDGERDTEGERGIMTCRSLYRL